MPHALASRLPPAARFLLEQVCLPGAAPAATPTPPAAPEPPELIEEARRQLLTGLLYQWALAQQPPAPLTEPLRRELAPLHQASVLRGLGLLDETLRITDLLGRRGIRTLALKGPVLSKRYYGDFGARDAGDADLLVDEAAAPEADRLLREAGYRRTKPRETLRGRRLRLYLETQHEFGYFAPAGATAVELHWRFADCRQISSETFPDLWARAETLDAAGAQLRLLSPTDTFVQLAIHGYTDGWSRLKWIADLPRVLATIPETEIERIATAARAGPVGRILDLALVLAGRPPGQDTAWLDPALKYIAHRLQNPHPRMQPAAQRIRHALAAARYNSALLNTPQLRRAAAYCNLIMPADFDHLRLPDPLTPALPYLAQLHRGLRRLGQTG